MKVALTIPLSLMIVPFVILCALADARRSEATLATA